MKKYGLQLRVPPDQQKKMALKPPIHPPPSTFGDDYDDDASKEISRQASKSRALQMIDEQQKKALDEDPLAFDYDGVYDKMKMNAARSRLQDQSKREPKYITSIIENAKKRELEHEIIYERKLLKERSKDDHEYEDKEKFVTGAYKKQLAERAKWLDQEKLQGLLEEREDVTKKSDLSDFYFSLNKNVAFGARSAHRSSKLEQPRSTAGKAEGDKPHTEAAASVGQDRERGDEQVRAFLVPHDIVEGAAAMTPDADMKQISPLHENIELSSEGAPGDKKDDRCEEGEVERERFRRSEDAIRDARERFLARKKMKQL